MLLWKHRRAVGAAKIRVVDASGLLDGWCMFGACDPAAARILDLPMVTNLQILVLYGNFRVDTDSKLDVAMSCGL